MAETVRKRTVAVLSPCGGTGASIFCKEAGLFLAKKTVASSPLRVLIADMHNGNGAQETLMNFPDCRYSLASLLSELRGLPAHSEEVLKDFAAWENIERFLCYDRERNIYVLTAPETAVKSPVNASEALCIYRALSGHFDVLLIDPPCGFSQASAEAACEYADRIIFTVRDDADSIEKMLLMRGELKRAGFLQKAEESGAILLLSAPGKSRYMTEDEIGEYLGFRILARIPYYGPAWTFTNIGSTMTGSDTPVSKAYRRACEWILPEIAG